MAGAIKDFFNRNLGRDPKESYWTCPRCRTQNPLGTPFCIKCAEEEEKKEAENDKVKLETENNPLVAGLVQTLNAYLKVGQVPSREVAEAAAKMGIVVNAPQELALAPIAQLDKLADKFINDNRTMATGSGAVMGLPGGLFMLATIPADLSALTHYSFKMISGVAQTYGFETRSEEGRAIALLLYAGAQGIEEIKVGGEMVLLSSLTKNLLIKPYRDLITKRIIYQLAKEIGAGIAQRGVSRVIPLLGSVVGGTANYMFMSTLGVRVKNYYRGQLQDMQDKHKKPTAPLASNSPAEFTLGEDNPI